MVNSILIHINKALRIFLLVSMGFAWMAVPLAHADQELGLRLLETDEQGLTIELVTPNFILETGTVDGQPCQLIRIEGYGYTDTPGFPELPIRGTLVGIPAKSDPALEIVEARPITLAGLYDLCPAAQPVVETDLAGQVVYRGEARQRDPQIYTQDAFVPASPSEMVDAGFLRSQRVAKVLFQPFLYNPVNGELRFYQHIQVRLEFKHGEETEPSSQKKVPGTLPSPGSRRGNAGEGSFEKLLQNSLLNYVTARQWRSYPQAQSLSLKPVETSYVTYPSYKIVVDQEGIYQVTYQDLVDAGADLDEVDPHTFRLFHGGDYRLGQELAIYVIGEDDNSFDPGDLIIFYGQKVDTRYTGENAYFLSWGSLYGMRMQVLDGTPDSGSIPDQFLTTQHMESNTWYFSEYPSGENDDVWYWDFVYAQPGPAYKDYTTTLNHISTSSGLTGKLRGLLKGYLVEGSVPDPQHHVRIYLNGNLVHEAWWDFKRDYSFDVDISQGFLIEGTNTIRITIPADAGITRDIVLVNWFEIDYWKTFVSEDDRLDFFGTEPVSPRTSYELPGSVRISASPIQFQVTDFSVDTLEVFEVTDPFNVARVTPFELTPESGKYRLTFERMVTGEQSYIAQSLANRLSPVSVVMDSISDLHSSLNGADYLIITHSDFYTESVRLADYRVTQGWRVEVVKVEDVYDEFSGGVMNAPAIQVFLAWAYGHWQSPAPLYVLLVGDGNYDPRNYLGFGEINYIPPLLEQVDPWLGERPAENRFVAVSGEDNLPDMYLGRLPVKTSAEASTMVDKILAYEQTPSTIDWHDWRREALFVADKYDPGAGDFAALSDAVADHYLPFGYGVQKVYYKVTHSDKTAVQAAIVEAINQGRLLVNYVGHGSIQLWGIETLFSVSLISSLTNTGKLPFMVPMTCLEGSFDYPSPAGHDSSSLSERLVREPDKGAIASFAPTGFGVAQGHDFLNKGLYLAIFTDNETQVGPATTQAKLYLYANSGGAHLELLDTYALLGDPLLRLSLVQNYYSPIIMQNNP
jgi:hypothetical protein